jgi:hypothetical protein
MSKITYGKGLQSGHVVQLLGSKCKALSFHPLVLQQEGRKEEREGGREKVKVRKRDKKEERKKEGKKGGREKGRMFVDTITRNQDLRISRTSSKKDILNKS